MALDICYFSAFIIEAVIAWQYFSKRYSEHKRDIVELSIFLFGYMIMFIMGRVDIFWVSGLNFFVVNACLLRMVYHLNFKTICFQSFVLTVFMSIAELVVAVFFSWRLGNFLSYREDIPIFVIYMLINKLFYFFLLQLVLRIFPEKKDIAENQRHTFLLCIIPAISMWVMITFLMLIAEMTFPFPLDWMVIVSALLLMVINIFAFWLYDYIQQMDRDFLNVQLQLQSESANMAYYEMLVEQDRAQRILVHDMKNHLHAIQTLNQQKDSEQIDTYIEQLVHSAQLHRVREICQNKILNAILSKCVVLCEEKQIDFVANIRKGSVDNLKDSEVVALFGNLVDNAIEAADGMEGAYIELETEYKTEQKAVFITMVNSCAQKPRYTVGGHMLSRKKNKTKHGMGIKSIQKIVDIYHGSLKMYYNEEDHAFHTIVLLYTNI